MCNQFVYILYIRSACSPLCVREVYKNCIALYTNEKTFLGYIPCTSMQRDRARTHSNSAPLPLIKTELLRTTANAYRLGNYAALCMAASGECLFSLDDG